jgi:tripartite-type tricarboxylate transporter receptor subunit TctC
MEQAMKRLSTLSLCMALLSGSMPFAVEAQTYPNRTVRVVVAYPPGGPTDLVGVAEPKRSPLMPDSPTVAEAGVPGFESSAWFGYFGPGAMPRELRVHLASEMTGLMQGADLQNRILGLGAVPLWTTPDQFADYFREESIHYARIIKEAGIKLD